MSFNLDELSATITINAGRLAVDLERLKDELTGHGFILKRWHGQHVYNRILRACDRAALECARDLKDAAVEQTPWKTHALQESAYIAKIGEGDSAGYQVGFDLNNGQNIRDKYGIIQHKTEWFNHPRGGKANFLKDPFNANIRSYISRIKSVLKGAVK